MTLPHLGPCEVYCHRLGPLTGLLMLKSYTLSGMWTWACTGLKATIEKLHPDSACVLLPMFFGGGVMSKPL